MLEEDPNKMSRPPASYPHMTGPPRPPRAKTKWLPFVLSALLAAVVVRIALREPALAALLALIAAVLTLPAAAARRRLRSLLRSGDVRSVLAAWSDSYARMPYPETMGPLVTAAAFASCGWVDEARTAMSRSARGPAWDAALEHRLFVETLLDVFEGDRDAAMMKAEHLAALPLPVAGPFAQTRVRTLRGAVAAFARAFAHRSVDGDAALLEDAGQKSPLVFWAMRYAAAVVAVDRGEPNRARQLLEGAPRWPEQSAFSQFHAELAPLVGLPALPVG